MAKNGVLKIEKGVPAPTSQQGGGKGYQAVLITMKIGDSVVLPVKSHSNAWSIAAVGLGRGKFKVRRETTGGYRVWKTA